jgi:hypothetical protein
MAPASIARDMLGVTSVIVLPFITTTLVAAVPPTVGAVATVYSVSEIVAAVARPLPEVGLMPSRRVVHHRDALVAVAGRVGPVIVTVSASVT